MNAQARWVIRRMWANRNRGTLRAFLEVVSYVGP